MSTTRLSLLPNHNLHPKLFTEMRDLVNGVEPNGNLAPPDASTLVGRWHVPKPGEMIGPKVGKAWGDFSCFLQLPKPAATYGKFGGGFFPAASKPGAMVEWVVESVTPLTSPFTEWQLGRGQVERQWSRFNVVSTVSPHSPGNDALVERNPHPTDPSVKHHRVEVLVKTMAIKSDRDGFKGRPWWGEAGAVVFEEVLDYIRRFCAFWIHGIGAFDWRPFPDFRSTGGVTHTQTERYTHTVVGPDGGTYGPQYGEALDGKPIKSVVTMANGMVHPLSEVSDEELKVCGYASACVQSPTDA